MALTVYALLDNSQALIAGAGTTVAGPWQHSTTSFTDIATLTSSVNVVGFVDGSNRAKYFYSTATSPTVALPTLSAVPNAIPQGAVPLGTSGTSFVYVVAATPNASGGYSGGMLYFQVTPAAGSPDAGSPLQFSLDPYGLIICDSATTPWK
jgi:hypothetical protein